MFFLMYIFSFFCQYPCKSLGRKMSPLNTFVVVVAYENHSPPDCQSSTSISSSSSENSSVVWSLDEEGDCGKARCPWEVGEILGDLASGPPPWDSSMLSMLTSFCRVCGVIFLSDSTSAFISSRSRLSLALRFWNQVMTCALESPSCCAIWSRSAGERYFWYKNLFSSS